MRILYPSYIKENKIYYVDTGITYRLSIKNHFLECTNDSQPILLYWFIHDWYKQLIENKQLLYVRSDKKIDQTKNITYLIGEVFLVLPDIFLKQE